MKNYFLFLLLFLNQLGIAQPVADTINTPSARQYVASYYSNGVGLVCQPLHWQKKDWLVFGGAAAITTGLFFVDASINKPFAKWHDASSSFGKIGDVLGSTEVAVGSTLLTFGVAAVIKNPLLKNFALDNLQAQIFTGGFTYITKNIFGRARPVNGRGAHYWDGPLKSNGFESFFSGHSSVAFSTATMVYLHSQKKWWVGLLSYGAATGIAVSRLQYQKHWASDVFIGAVTGWAVAHFIYKKNKAASSNPSATSKIL